MRLSPATQAPPPTSSPAEGRPALAGPPHPLRRPRPRLHSGSCIGSVACYIGSVADCTVRATIQVRCVLARGWRRGRAGQALATGLAALHRLDLDCRRRLPRLVGRVACRRGLWRRGDWLGRRRLGHRSWGVGLGISRCLGHRFGRWLGRRLRLRLGHRFWLGRRLWGQFSGWLRLGFRCGRRGGCLLCDCRQRRRLPQRTTKALAGHCSARDAWVKTWRRLTAGSVRSPTPAANSSDCVSSCCARHHVRDMPTCTASEGRQYRHGLGRSPGLR